MVTKKIQGSVHIKPLSIIAKDLQRTGVPIGKDTFPRKNKMVPQLDANRPQRPIELAGDQVILPGIAGGAVRMVVGQDQAAGTLLEGDFQNAADVDADGVYHSSGKLLAADDPLLTVKAQEQGLLIPLIKEVGHEIIPGIGSGGEIAKLRCPIHRAFLYDLRDQAQQQRGGGTDASYLKKLLFAGVKNLLERAEAFEESVGDGIGIPPRNGKLQQQLQRTDSVKAGQAVLANIFSESVGCLLVLFIASFATQKLLSLSRSHFFIFAFISIILGDELKQILL